MNNLFEIVYEHPVWTVIFITAIGELVSKTISAIRGNEIKPLIDIKINKPENK